MVLAAWESVVGMSKTLLLIIVPTVSDTVREGRTVRTSGNGASERSRMKCGFRLGCDSESMARPALDCADWLSEDAKRRSRGKPNANRYGEMV